MTHQAFRITTENRPGVLHQLTGVLAAAGCNITTISSVPEEGVEGDRTRVHLEFVGEDEDLLDKLRSLPGVLDIEPALSAEAIYGKRIIVVGGGAQVGQVAMGAVSEADRHNIRGERISVDTIPLVGETELAAAVRAVTRLPRVHLLVLAGSLMGGEITRAVREVRERGVQVISLNMAGSVPEACDLVVTDPIQAGVMAVMAIADTASFDLLRQKRRSY